MENLSQEEIDALLEEATEEESGTTAESGSDSSGPGTVFSSSDSGAVPYDFNVPNTNLTRVFDRNLRGVSESFAKDSSLVFSNLLRTTCDFSYNGAEVRSFGETLSAFENPSCIALCSMEPLSGSVLFHVDSSLMFTFFTKLLGGPIEEPPQVRDFTEIEMCMARKVLQKVLESFGLATDKVSRLTPMLIQIENNPNYLNAFNDGEAVIVLEFTVMTGDLPGKMTFVLPQIAFEPVKEEYDPKEGLDVRNPADRMAERRRARSLVGQSLAEVSVRFDASQMPMRRLLEMKVGDSVRLDHHVSRPLEVLVEGRRLFRAHSGQLGQAQAVRILGPIKEKR
jgi:flagellar motor switch protein FliM